MGFEPTTVCLASRSSTPELPPHYKYLFEGYKMKKLLLAVPLVLLSLNCFAAEPSGQVAKKPVLCFALDEILNHLKSEYGETVSRKFGKIDFFETDAMLLENTEKGSWTIIEYKDNVGCVIASGKGANKV